MHRSASVKPLNTTTKKVKTLKKVCSKKDNHFYKLLHDLVHKYKSTFVRDVSYLNKLEKKTMVEEIRMLAEALLHQERLYKKQLDMDQVMIKRLSSGVKEAEK